MTVYRICSSIKFTHCYFTDNQQGKARFKLEDCFVLNEHNAVFARSGPLYATCVSLGPPESSTQTASRSLQPFLQGSLGDRPTDYATRSVTIAGLPKRTVEKPNSVIVYGHNKYLVAQSTRQIRSTSAISSYIQM